MAISSRATEAATRLAIVLVHPLIAANTGNIGRTCLGLNAALHLIKPLGFDLSEKAVKRAGLDYWPNVNLTVHEDWAAFCHTSLPTFDKVVFFSKAAKYGTRCIFDSDLSGKQVALVFGSESHGIDAIAGDTLAAHTVAYLPMESTCIRSYNLSNAVAAAAMEAVRQNGWWRTMNS